VDVVAGVRMARHVARARGIGTVDDGTIAHVCTTGI
jgi:hypothetical protein